MRRSIIDGDRFQLRTDFTDPFGGFHHPKGERGTVLNVFTSQNEALVEFDGYDDAKQDAQVFAKQYGEAMNCSPYRTVLPLKLLDQDSAL